MTDYFITLYQSLLQNNLVLIQLLGVSAFIAASTRLRSAIELAQLFFLIMVSACAINMVLHFFILEPLGLEFAQLPLFAVTGAAVASALCLLLQRYLPLAARGHGISLLFFGGSSAVVGTSLLAQASAPGFGLALAFIIGTALGYSLLLVLVAAMRQRLEAVEIPKSFRGAPAILICMGIVSLCLLTLQDL